MNKAYLLIVFSLVLSSCKEDEQSTPQSSRPNILFIIADDLGKDAINGYTEGSVKPNTPHLDSLRNAGLKFNNFWAYPTCTPTRSSIITGKYGYSTKVISVGDELDESEESLQKFINENATQKYSTAVVGKWHLAGNDLSDRPENFGIDYYAGLISGAARDYYNWDFTEDGITRKETTYATSYFTDLAIDWINDQQDNWFMWLAYNAPHNPFHVPPDGLHSQGDLPEFQDGMEELPYFFAMIEAMDAEIGRLLDNIPKDELQNTVIIFIGDNGTAGPVIQDPYNSRKAKSSLFQGGINVPMFISGSGVTRLGEDNNLITSTDLYTTIGQIAGVITTEIHDSKSFYNQLTSSTPSNRKFQYSERFTSDDEWVISDGEYKLFQDEGGDEEMYHIQEDPYERSNLLDNSLTSDQERAKAELTTQAALIRK